MLFCGTYDVDNNPSLKKSPIVIAFINVIYIILSSPSRSSSSFYSQIVSDFDDLCPKNVYYVVVYVFTDKALCHVKSDFGHLYKNKEFLILLIFYFLF